MDDSRSEIQSFYKGKTIFITGATGFMGKVLMEKLLYCCSDLDKMYILIRGKRGRTFDMRLEDIFNLPLFQRILKEKPQVVKKVIPLNGDILSDNLGLTDDQHERLINEVNVMFHNAASLRLEAKLKDAIEMNTTGTKKVLDLAKQMKHLVSFVHLSTAFCHVDQEELGERVFDAPHDPHEIMKLVQWLDEEALDLITPKLLDPHPNCYTYSKRLTETLVANEYPNLPCCIARPSIVCPAYKEPLPGWVDNLNGPTGLLVGAGKGVIRSMHCKANYYADVIPVDFAINSLVAIAWYITVQEKTKSIPVFNITQRNVSPLTWGDILETGRKIIYDYPFEGQIWYPDGDMRSSKFVHNLFVFFFHIIPAYFIDFLMVLLRQKKFMVRLQKRISVGLEVLQYFTTRNWLFHNQNIFILYDKMTPADKKIFPTVLHEVDVIAYFKNVILGTRQYCMKESLNSLSRARRHQRRMYILHVVTIYLFYFGVLYLIYCSSDTLRLFLNYTTELMKSLPLIGGLIEKVHL